MKPFRLELPTQSPIWAVCATRDAERASQSMTRRIAIEAIPHKQQRGEAPSSWRKDEYGDFHVDVTAMNLFDDDAFILAVQEMCQAKFCYDAGISWKEIHDYNRHVEAQRKKNEPPVMKPPHHYEIIRAQFIGNFLDSYLKYAASERGRMQE